MIRVREGLVALVAAALLVGCGGGSGGSSGSGGSTDPKRAEELIGLPAPTTFPAKALGYAKTDDAPFPDALYVHKDEDGKVSDYYIVSYREGVTAEESMAGQEGVEGSGAWLCMSVPVTTEGLDEDQKVIAMLKGPRTACVRDVYEGSVGVVGWSTIELFGSHLIEDWQ